MHYYIANLIFNYYIIEHIGKPQSVKYETGASSLTERRTADPGRTWHSSQYLKRRTRQLQPIMVELDPYNPVGLHRFLLCNGI